ncbi:MAG: ComF family protein [Patescibacteria group bacterium]
MGLKSFLLNLLFPINCLGCGQEGDWLCSACFKKITFGQRQKMNLKTPDLDQVFIAGDYNDPLLAGLIKKFKYNFIAALGPILARWLIMFWSGQVASQAFDMGARPLADKPNNFLVIPIPLAQKRLRWRGFNQAEIIAREFSAAFGYPLNCRDLKRSGRRRRQASLSEKERFNNIKGVFSWHGKPLGEDSSGTTIILIDDLITTGATLNEAARTLKAAGAKQIYGLILAKG